MFQGCNLDLSSLKNIAETIKDVSNSDNVHEIFLGADVTWNQLYGESVMYTLRKKGWECQTKVNNYVTSGNLTFDNFIGNIGCYGGVNFMFKDDVVYSIGNTPIASFPLSTTPNASNIINLETGETTDGQEPSSLFFGSEGLIFDSPLTCLVDGSYMFYGCINLSISEKTLLSLGADTSVPMTTKGMFMNTTMNPTHFYPKEIGSNSFYYDVNSDDDEYWRGAVSYNYIKLVNAESMFSGCSSLVSFETSLRPWRIIMTNDFNTDVPYFNGKNMFYNCTSLSYVVTDLGSLENGEGMFYNCKLGVESIWSIAHSIRKTTGNERFDIGIDPSLLSDEQVKNILGLIKYKGWDLYVNGNNDESNYNLPEFAGCTTAEECTNRWGSVNWKVIPWCEDCYQFPDLQYCDCDGDGENGIPVMLGYNDVWVDLSSLVSARRMFASSGYGEIEGFHSSLKNLVDGTNMFLNSGLRSFCPYNFTYLP